MSTELISLVSSEDAPVQRPSSLRSPLTKFIRSLGGDRSNQETSDDNHLRYPLKIRYTGRAGGVHTLFTSSSEAREVWKTRIEKLLRAHKSASETYKVGILITFSLKLRSSSIQFFKLVPIALETSVSPAADNPSTYGEKGFTRNATCSVPFGKLLHDNIGLRCSYFSISR